MPVWLRSHNFLMFSIRTRHHLQFATRSLCVSVLSKSPCPNLENGNSSSSHNFMFMSLPPIDTYIYGY